MRRGAASGRQPYTFRPAEAKMASLHAKAGPPAGAGPFRLLRGALPLSGGAGEEGGSTWGCRALPDLAERLQDERNLALVCRRCRSSRRHRSTPCAKAWRTRPPPALQGALLERIGKEQECAEPDAETLAYLCRALASCPGNGLRSNKLLTLLQTRPSPSPAARHRGPPLARSEKSALLGLFLEQLALQPTQFFNQVFAELVTLPALRNDMLARLRDPARSEASSARP